MVVPVEWDRRHKWGENRRTRTIARRDWLGDLGALTLYNGQKVAIYRAKELET